MNRFNWKPAVFQFLLITGIPLLSLVGRWGYGEGKLLDPDSVYMFRIAKIFSGLDERHILEGRPYYKDTLSYYPSYRDLRFEELLLPWLGGKFYALALRVGLPKNEKTLESFLYHLTFVFFALSVLAVFLLFRLLFNHFLGFCVAAFYAVSPAVLVRVWPGSYDKECLSGFFIFLMLAAFFQSSSKNQFLFPKILWGLMAGFFLALAKMTWGGYQFYGAVLASSLAIYIILWGGRKKYEDLGRNYGFSFILFYVTGTLLAWMINPCAHPLNQTGNPFEWFSYLCLALAGLLILKGFFKRLGTFLFWGSVIVLILGGGFYVLTGCSEFLKGVLNFGGSSEVTAHSIDEFASGNGILAYRYFGLLLFVFPFGLLLSINRFFKEKSFSLLLMGVWLAAALLGFLARKRFSAVLAIPVSFYALYPIYFLGAWVFERFSATQKHYFWLRLGSSLILGMSVCLLLLESCLTSLKSTPMVLNAIQFTRHWRDAAEWARSHTEPNAVLVSWWDYGYYLQTFGERATLVDGGNREDQRNVDLADMLTNSEKEFGPLIAKYKPENRPIYLLIGESDLGKMMGINAHAHQPLPVAWLNIPYTGSVDSDQELLENTIYRYGIKTYYVADQERNYFLIYLVEKDARGANYPQLREKLLIRLLPFHGGEQDPPEYFQQVYQNGYVYVYKYQGPLN